MAVHTSLTKTTSFLLTEWRYNKTPSAELTGDRGQRRELCCCYFSICNTVRIMHVLYSVKRHMHSTVIVIVIVMSLLSLVIFIIITIPSLCSFFHAAAVDMFCLHVKLHFVFSVTDLCLPILLCDCIHFCKNFMICDSI